MADIVVWTKDMSVGCDALDDDHKVLVQALNDFIEAVELDEGVFVTDGIFTVLLDYSNYHFTREEAIMEACGYSDIANHKATHNALKEQLLDARRRYMLNPSPGLEDEIREFLMSWLRSHILVSDMDYKSVVEQSGTDIEAVLKSVA
ncbi:MAG: bacteriohemerythrin [Magnetovibrio sp.]|nr:bacteriohemerythrin [Magnetovibrio sp.]